MDPAARWTAAQKGNAFFAYATNCLTDLDNSVIVDVEASRTMLERTQEGFVLYPERLHEADA